MRVDTRCYELHQRRRSLHLLIKLYSERDSSAGGASDQNAWRNTDKGSILRCDKVFLSHSQLWVQIRCSYSSVWNRMHQHLSARWKIPKLAVIPLLGHTKILHVHTGRNGYSLSCGCFGLTQVRRLEFPARDNEVLGKKIGSRPSFACKPGIWLPGSFSLIFPYSPLACSYVRQIWIADRTFSCDLGPYV